MIKLIKLHHRNLHNINIPIQIQLFTIITSGKNSSVVSTLVEILRLFTINKKNKVEIRKL